MNKEPVKVFAGGAAVLVHTLVLSVSYLNYDPNEITYDTEYADRVFSAVLVEETDVEEKKEEEVIKPVEVPPPPKKRTRRKPPKKKPIPPPVVPKEEPPPLTKDLPPKSTPKASTDSVKRSRRTKNQVNATPDPIVSTESPGGLIVPNMNSGGTSDKASSAETSEEKAQRIAQEKRERRRLERDYHGQLKRYFKRHYEYPKRARLARIEGEVWIEVIIDRKGKILSYTLYRSSGAEILDQAALRDVAKLGSVPAPPKSVKWKKGGRKVRIPFRYTLRT